MTEILLSPSILSADFSCLGQQLQSIEAAGADWVHIDVMDGKFVPNITMGPVVVEACKRSTRLPLDVHLMIEKPEQHIQAFASAGADTISVHLEGNPNIHRTIQEIRSLGCKPAIVLNPATPACMITPLIPFIDMVLIMTVNPGFSGQKFIPEMIGKIQEVKRLLEEYRSPAFIQVDGGISADTLPAVFKAGARCFVAGSAVFNHPNGVQAAIEALRAAAV